MVILSKASKSDNLESPDILALWETNLNGSIVCCNFSLGDYLPLIRKDSVTHERILLLTVYMKEGRPFERGFSLENSADS